MERDFQEEAVEYGVSMSSPQLTQQAHPLGPAHCPLNISIMCFFCKITYKGQVIF